MDNNESDICLTLLDNDDNQLVLILNRQILSKSCLYFEKLLTGNFSESLENKITIFVPNVVIVNDIITSFCGLNTTALQSYEPCLYDLEESQRDLQSHKTCSYDLEESRRDHQNWEYYLETCLCRDFLMLDCSMYLESILNTTVPDQQFDLLLNVMDIIKRDLLNLEDKLAARIKINKMVKYLIKKTPKNFDVNSIPKNIYNDIHASSFNNILLFDNDDIIIQNYTTGNNITLNCKLNGQYIFVSKTNQLILNNETITFIDIVTGEQIFYLKNSWNCCVYNTYHGKKYALDISLNHKYLVCGSTDYTIKLFDIEEKKIINTWYPHYNGVILKNSGITHILFTLDNKYIIVSGYKNSCETYLNKYDLEGNLIWSKQKLGDFWHYIDIICLNKKIVLLGLGPHNSWIEVINLETGNDIYCENKYNESDYICHMENNCIGIASDDIIYIYDIDTQQEITILGVHNRLNNLFYNKKNNHLISCCKNKMKIWDPKFGLIEEIFIDHQIISLLSDYSLN
ncbi:putative BTB/POZ domain-containing protein [Cotonvirus japonicus]|uniref:BTB/POZ domain-containing protein n=1 Tax=Cotonvirus japonicus TaxID=2811091 RepID=A0ABM7NR02_9VIRU|nr:putative BTB/POZ domain-containing protein [Cotonvirus japonicus]BCS82589.1 putative BTB/POZ domain-containing protein [Cotonvirus japonicus]